MSYPFAALLSCFVSSSALQSDSSAPNILTYPESVRREQEAHEAVLDAIAKLNLPQLELPPGAVQAGPLVCMEPTHDLGTFWADERPDFAFELRNISDVGIAVYPLIPASIAYFRDPTITIPPHQSLTWPVWFKTDAMHGSFTKTMEFRITGVDVSTPVAAEPPNPSDRRSVRRADERSRSGGNARQGISYEERLRREHEIEAAISKLNLPQINLPPGAVQAGPLVCREPKYDFGEVWAIGRLTHAFRLENISDVEIGIVFIDASCGTCANREIAIGPHDSHDYPAGVRTDNLHNEFTKTIIVKIVRVGNRAESP